MNLFVSLTDWDWFERLRQMRPDEVNFWRPSPRQAFAALKPGEALLFKLHSPRRAIVGGGYFVRYTRAPVSLAWEAFGEKNGVKDRGEFLRRVRQYRTDSRGSDPDIGCILLNEPFFFPEELWVPEPEDWHRNTQVGKTYDTAAAIGARVWDTVVERMADPRAIVGPHLRTTDTATFGTTLGTPAEGDRYGAAYLTRARLGQGSFRVLVTDAYARRCAVTGERILPVLEAAHIRPYAEEGPHRVSNGLLLRSDLHTLFDRGYVTVDPDLRFHVSGRLREEFHNGVDYYRLEGERLRSIPLAPPDRPARSFLEWHNDVVFQP